MAATPGTALAHEGAVTSVLAMQDGLNLLTAGSDQRVRLWDAGESWAGRDCWLGHAACAARQACMTVLVTLVALDLNPSLVQGVDSCQLPGIIPLWLVL